MKSILILTPFKNESHSIPHYMKALRALDYPPEFIDVYWLENDSSDITLRMLKAEKPNMPFKSTTLENIRIRGPVKKRKPGRYIKDVAYGGGRRIPSWIVIWNGFFLPLIRKSQADYVLTWFADVVIPPETINEYLKVFELKPDAGWAGGAMHRRLGFPRSTKTTLPLAFPNYKLASSKKIVEAPYTGHCWMTPRAAFAKTEFQHCKGRDMHLSLIAGLVSQGLKVYYQPSVYLQHVSTDGVIYNKSL